MSIDITILRPGYASYKQLYGETERAIAQLAAPATLTKVEDIREIMTYKILATHALVIDGESNLQAESRTLPRLFPGLQQRR